MALGFSLSLSQHRRRTILTTKDGQDRSTCLLLISLVLLSSLHAAFAFRFPAGLRVEKLRGMMGGNARGGRSNGQQQGSGMGGSAMGGGGMGTDGGMGGGMDGGMGGGTDGGMGGGMDGGMGGGTDGGMGGGMGR
ncbi:hypothetical protein CLOM_g1799 [Closterium sp. NIES-68]|nr:hypothetical protein CLOM_g1799 [Closterium sp. NIES-68]